MKEQELIKQVIKITENEEQELMKSVKDDHDRFIKEYRNICVKYKMQLTSNFNNGIFIGHLTPVNWKPYQKSDVEVYEDGEIIFKSINY